MIKIKDYIFNENEIEYIKSGTTFKENGTALLVKTNGLNIKTKKKDLLFEDATFEDIEWNYGTPQETQRQIQKELCKSCYYRDTISNKIKELEEENKTLKELNVCVGCDNNPDYKSRINRAIEYLEHEQFKRIILGFGKSKYLDAIKNKTIEILKGEE